MRVAAVVEESQPGFNNSRTKGCLRVKNTPRCSKCLLCWIQAQCSGLGHVRPLGATAEHKRMSRGGRFTLERAFIPSHHVFCFFCGFLLEFNQPISAQLMFRCMDACSRGSVVPSNPDVGDTFRRWIVEDRGANGCTCFVWCRGGRCATDSELLNLQPLPGLMWTRWCLTRSCMA